MRLLSSAIVKGSLLRTCRLPDATRSAAAGRPRSVAPHDSTSAFSEADILSDRDARRNWPWHPGRQVLNNRQQHAQSRL
jgi:hypothetical protein